MQGDACIWPRIDFEIEVRYSVPRQSGFTSYNDPHNSDEEAYGSLNITWTVSFEPLSGPTHRRGSPCRCGAFLLSPVLVLFSGYFSSSLLMMKKGGLE